MDSWRILIVNVTLASRTGTETVVRDLALGLKAAGQKPMVYSPELGPIADEIRSSGIPVFSQLRNVPEPDIVHGNHHVETVEALLQFRKARGLFVCHDRRAHMSAPPRMGRILRYVAIDYNCLERLTEEYEIPEDLARVIYNSVDTGRYHPRPPLPQRPRRALVFSNYAGPATHLDTVQQACRELKLPMDVIGSAAGNSCTAPELILGRYDIVFAKDRCALEAMAVGAAVVLCDTTGLGPLVTSAEVAELRRWNFGTRTLREPLDPAGIVQRVQRYDAADAAMVSRYIREHANHDSALERYLQLYDELMGEPLPAARTIAGEIDECLWHTATKMAQMEVELEQYRRPYRMEALSVDASERLRLSIKDCSDVALCGRVVHARVEVENRSAEKIGTYPPFPVQLCYRWLRDGTDEVAIPEGPRTELRPPLSSGAKASYSMRIVSPAEAGRYRLRVTLVQERVRWLDGLPSPVSAETAVLVRDSTPATIFSEARLALKRGRAPFPFFKRVLGYDA